MANEAPDHAVELAADEMADAASQVQEIYTDEANSGADAASDELLELCNRQVRDHSVRQ